MTSEPERKAFVTQLRVRFGDVDPAGIVYYPKIYDFLHQAFEEVWDVHVGKRYYHLVGEDRIGFPLVHSEVEFKHPLRFGDRPIVKVTCFRLGRSSLGLHYRFFVADVLCVDARMTTVCVELEDLESKDMPDEFRLRFEAIMEEQ